MKRTVALGLKLVFSAGLIATLLFLADPQSVWAQVTHASWQWVFLAGSCLLAVTGLMAWRWRYVARELGLELSFWRATREYLISNLVNQTLPGGVVGDAARAVRVRDAATLKTAVWSVAIERLLGQIALVAVMTTGFAVSLTLPGGIAWPVWAWILVAIPFGIAILARRMEWPPMTQIRFFLRNPMQILLSLTIFALLVTAFWASSRAVGANLPLESLFTLIPLILSAMLVPLSIGGWGWREGAAAALFPLAGLEMSAGIAAGVVYGALLLLTAFPAVVLLLLPKSLKPHAAGESELAT
ncbi:MAG: lysylphosphatidylglycerol synthase transmembrane domain-containing protein [Pseudomonadota bacterium]